MRTVNRFGGLSMAVSSVIAAGLGLVAVTAAIAAQPQGGALSTCKGELTRLCAGVEAGNGKKMNCLLQHQGQLSADGDAAITVRVQTRSDRLGGVDVAQAAPAAGTAAPAATLPPAAAVKPVKSVRLNKKACRAELATLCATTTVSRTKCLMANQPKLGPECAAAVAVVAQTREVAKAACVVDAAKLCGAVRGAARTQCLEANKAQLSPACLARIERKEAKQAVKAASPATSPTATPKQ